MRRPVECEPHQQKEKCAPLKPSTASNSTVVNAWRARDCDGRESQRADSLVSKTPSMTIAHQRQDELHLEKNVKAVKTIVIHCVAIAYKVQDVFEHAMLSAALACHILLAPLILIATPSHVTTKVEPVHVSSSNQKLHAVLHSANASELCGQRATLAEQRALQLLRAQASDQQGNNIECPFGGLLQGSLASGKHG